MNTNTYKQTDIVTASKPHGGKRENSGRKLKNNEPTATIRLPISIIEKIKNGYFENVTNSNSDNSKNKCLRCCYYSDVINHCTLNNKLNEQGDCADYKNVIQKINKDSLLISQLSKELSQYKPEENFYILKLSNFEYAAIKKYCESKKKSIETGLMNAIETAANANKEIADYKKIAKKAESKLQNQQTLETSNYKQENQSLKTELADVTCHNSELQKEIERLNIENAQLKSEKRVLELEQKEMDLYIEKQKNINFSLKSELFNLYDDLISTYSEIEKIVHKTKVSNDAQKLRALLFLNLFRAYDYQKFKFYVEHKKEGILELEKTN